MTTYGSNPARDLAAKGTKGPWRQEPDTAAGRVWITAKHSVWPGDFAPIFEVRTDKEYATREADAGKAVRVVNALPALADHADAIEDYRTHRRHHGIGVSCGNCSTLLRAVFTTWDAVAAALTGDAS